MWLRKYLTVFKLSWQRLLEYRINFVFGCVRDLTLIITLYFLWITVFSGKVGLFDFNQRQMVAYVFGASFLSTFVLSYSMDNIADAVADGSFSGFLLKPWGNPLIFYFTNAIARRLMRLVFFSLEFVAFLIIFKPNFLWQTNIGFISSTVVSLTLAILLFTLIDFIFGLTAFWTLHAYGPRFALKMAVEFVSGRFFPLNILPVFLFRIVNFLPFSFLVFFPLNVYLGRLSAPEIYQGLLAQIIWIVFFSVLLKIVWQRGLRRYEAVGG